MSDPSDIEIGKSNIPLSPYINKGLNITNRNIIRKIKLPTDFILNYILLFKKVYK